MYSTFSLTVGHYLWKMIYFNNILSDFNGRCQFNSMSWWLVYGRCGLHPPNGFIWLHLARDPQVQPHYHFIISSAHQFSCPRQMASQEKAKQQQQQEKASLIEETDIGLHWCVILIFSTCSGRDPVGRSWCFFCTTTLAWALCPCLQASQLGYHVGEVAGSSEGGP